MLSRLYVGQGVFAVITGRDTRPVFHPKVNALYTVFSLALIEVTVVIIENFSDDQAVLRKDSCPYRHLPLLRLRNNGHSPRQRRGCIDRIDTVAFQRICAHDHLIRHRPRLSCTQRVKHPAHGRCMREQLRLHRPAVPTGG